MHKKPKSGNRLAIAAIGVWSAVLAVFCFVIAPANAATHHGHAPHTTPIHVSIGRPAWLRWHPARSFDGYPCVIVWGRMNKGRTRPAIRLCEDESAFYVTNGRGGDRAPMPRWIHWKHTSEHWRGQPCVIVWGYRLGVSQVSGVEATVCRGQAFTSNP